MSGEGVIAARPGGVPDAIERPAMTGPGVMLKLGEDGVWRVLLLVPHRLPFGTMHSEVLLTEREANKLGWALVEHAALIRCKELGADGA